MKDATVFDPSKEYCGLGENSFGRDCPPSGDHADDIKGLKGGKLERAKYTAWLSRNPLWASASDAARTQAYQKAVDREKMWGRLDHSLG